MAALFQVNSSENRARTGSLRLAHRSIETPAALIYTRRGSALNLTPDVLSSLGSAAQNIYVDVCQFLDAPPPEILEKHPGRGRGFLSWQNYLLVASARDPLLASYSRWQKGSNKGVKVDVISGSLEVSPSRYMDAVEAFQPDLFVSLSDEVPPGADLKRARVSVDRTLSWLDACLQQHKARSLASCLPIAALQGAGSINERRRSAAESAKRNCSGFALCGFGLGEDSLKRTELLTASNDELPEHLPRLLPGSFSPLDALEAVACGTDLLDTSHAVSAANQGIALSLFSTPGSYLEVGVLPQLAGKNGTEQSGAVRGKRLLHGTSGKAKLMKLAADRDQLQPSSSADQATQGAADQTASSGAAGAGSRDRNGVCLNAADISSAGFTHADSVFAAAEVAAGVVDEEAQTEALMSAAAATGAAFDGVNMNMLSLTYRADERPLVEGCSCFACRMHTRAYVHHLFNVQEMLGKVLLEVHNTHQYLQLFSRMRTAVTHGEFQELVDDMRRRVKLVHA